MPRIFSPPCLQNPPYEERECVALLVGPQPLCRSHLAGPELRGQKRERCLSGQHPCWLQERAAPRSGRRQGTVCFVCLHLLASIARLDAQRSWEDLQSPLFPATLSPGPTTVPWECDAAAWETFDTPWSPLTNPLDKSIRFYSLLLIWLLHCIRQLISVTFSHRLAAPGVLPVRRLLAGNALSSAGSGFCCKGCSSAKTLVNL